MGNLILGMGLIPCAWSDLKYGRVFNKWLLLMALAGVAVVGLPFLPGALPFLLFGMFLFAFRFMGAGDGKLMAVIGGFLGVRDGLYAVGAGFLAGAVWSLWKFWRSGTGLARVLYLCHYIRTVMVTGKITPNDTLEDAGADHHIPFAACLAAGVWLYLAVQVFNKKGG